MSMIARASKYRGPVAPVNTALPSWWPTVGGWKNIPVTNTQASATPSMYTSVGANIQMVWERWTSAAFNPDFSVRGAAVYHGGGHNSSSLPNVQGAYVLDLDGPTWYYRCAPTVVHNEGSVPETYDSYGEYADGSPFAAHIYDSFQWFPKAWGGGTQGSIIKVGFAGSAAYNAAHTFDLSQTTLGYQRVVDVITLGSFSSPTSGNDTGSYGGLCFDRVRQGWWYGASSDTGRTAFMGKPVSGVSPVTYYAGNAGSNLAGSGKGMAIHEGLDMIVSASWTLTSAPRLRVMNPASPLPAGWVNAVLQLGTAPSFPVNDGTSIFLAQCGIRWSKWAQKLYMHDSIGTPQGVYWLEPTNPADATQPWNLNLEILTSQDGSVIAPNTSGNPDYGKLVECDLLPGFVWCPNSTNTPQILRSIYQV